MNISEPIWLVGTQVRAEHQQNKKLDQRENISTILSLTICHCIFLNFEYWILNLAIVNTATKKDLPEKLSWNALVWCHFVPCKRTKLFSKTFFLADYKRYIFTVAFFILIKQNKYAELCNYASQWNFQKLLPGGNTVKHQRQSLFFNEVAGWALQLY